MRNDDSREGSVFSLRMEAMESHTQGGVCEPFVVGIVGANGTADGLVSPKAIGRDQSAFVRPSAP